MPTVYNRYNAPRQAGRINFVNTLGRTRQEFKNECDINQVMARYAVTGILPQPWKSPPTALFGDFAEAPDYQEAQTLLARARQQFASLSSRIRERFNNDPVQLLDFVHNKNNQAEAHKLGLLDPGYKPPAPPPAEIVK